MNAMSRFDPSSHSFWQDRPPREPQPVDMSPWDHAKQITDNRLRAMRFHIEEGDSDCNENVNFLQSNLLARLADFARDLTKEDPYGETGDRDRLDKVIGMVEKLGADHWPKFEKVYDLIGVEVPKIVKGGARSFSPPWVGRRSHRGRVGEFGTYDMGVARDIVHRDPWM